MQKEVIASLVVWAIYNRNNYKTSTSLKYNGQDYQLSVQNLSDSKSEIYINNQLITINVSGSNFSFDGAGFRGSGQISGQQVSQLSMSGLSLSASQIRFNNDDKFSIQSVVVEVN